MSFLASFFEILKESKGISAFKDKSLINPFDKFFWTQFFAPLAVFDGQRLFIKDTGINDPDALISNLLELIFPFVLTIIES